MPPLEDLSDDAVAEQLKKEAKESSIKYSALGVDAFLPKRPANPTLKPNTRFLKAIIKEANSHNDALRKRGSSRDVTDSVKERSQQLPRDGSGAKDDSRHHKRSERSVIDAEGSRTRSRRERSVSDDEHQRRRKRRDHGERRSRHGRSRSPHKERDRNRSREHDRERRHGHRLESPERGSQSSRRRKHRHHHRSRSPAPRERRDESSEHKGKSTKTHRRRSSEDSRSQGIDEQQEDSDPLEKIVNGPSTAKQPVPRGRGANKSRSQMDEHFSASYNPAMDVQPDSGDDDDWGQALEALRDRQRWKELGANRLREAGFSDREVNKWERGGEQREEDIRWKRTGEGREWDRGKVTTAAGEVETPASWPT